MRVGHIFEGAVTSVLRCIESGLLTLVIILLLVLGNSTNLQAKSNSDIGVFGSFAVAPTNISNQFSLNGGAFLSLSIGGDWIFSIGSSNVITKNIRADFDYILKNSQGVERKFVPKLINNYFEAGVEKLFFFFADTCFGISAGLNVALNHAKYKIIVSHNDFLSASGLPNFGDDWYYVLMPGAGATYQLDEWFRFYGGVFYRVALDANYIVKNLDDRHYNNKIILSNKDMSGVVFVLKLQFGGF